jgi:hypothetical protein
MSSQAQPSWDADPVAWLGETHLTVHRVMLDGAEISVHIDLDVLRRLERQRKPGNSTSSEGGIFLYRSHVESAA